MIACWVIKLSVCLWLSNVKLFVACLCRRLCISSERCRETGKKRREREKIQEVLQTDVAGLLSTSPKVRPKPSSACSYSFAHAGIERQAQKSSERVVCLSWCCQRPTGNEALDFFFLFTLFRCSASWWLMVTAYSITFLVSDIWVADT